LPLFDTLFFSFWKKFGAVDAHKNLLSNCECRATWRSEIPTVLDGKLHAYTGVLISP